MAKSSQDSHCVLQPILYVFRIVMKAAGCILPNRWLITTLSHTFYNKISCNIGCCFISFTIGNLFTMTFPTIYQNTLIVKRFVNYLLSKIFYNSNISSACTSSSVYKFREIMFFPVKKRALSTWPHCTTGITGQCLYCIKHGNIKDFFGKQICAWIQSNQIWSTKEFFVIPHPNKRIFRKSQKSFS